jgi:hypothetical protein
MEIKCVLCDKPIDEGDLCDTCFEFFNEKYREVEEFEEAVEWHKDHAKELNEEE